MLQILLVCVIFQAEVALVFKVLLLVLKVLLLGNQPKEERKTQRVKRVFKEEWATQFPWVELVVDPPSKTHMVHCKVRKIINTKLDGLQKHVGKRKH